MFPSLLLLNCLFLTVGSSHGPVLPLRNVSLWRINDFEHMLSWVPPENSVGCKYKVSTKPTGDELTSKTSKTLSRQMEGGFLNVSIKSFCNKSESEPVVLNETNPELVMDFQCYVHSPTQTNCSWSPTSVAADLLSGPDHTKSVFQRVVGVKEPMVQHGPQSSLEIQECSSYIYAGGVKTGCYLPVTSEHSISVLFNATLNNKAVRNTFYRDLIKFVRPPPLNWTVKKSEDEFNISWDPPEVLALDQWTFIINYTECGKPKNISKKGVTSLQLPLASHCQYSMAIKAVSGDNGKTPWTSNKDFDARPSALMYLAILIPLVVASLTVLTVMCYQKNKGNIFPKVPEPRDLLSDICDNNNKSTLCHFQVPTVDEDNCKIALVIDPQITKADC